MSGARSVERARNAAYAFRGLADVSEFLDQLADDHEILISVLRGAELVAVDRDGKTERVSIHAPGDGYTPHAATLTHSQAERLAEILRAES